MNEELKKVAQRGRGKRDKILKGLWIDAFTDAIRTDPCGTILFESPDGKAQPAKREYTKKNAWVFEGLDEGAVDWGFITVLNLDKAAGAIRLTHTLNWCMAKLKSDRDLFTKGNLDRCRTRLRNLVTGDILMVAVLIQHTSE
jgi:hypothetical protein